MPVFLACIAVALSVAADETPREVPSDVREAVKRVGSLQTVEDLGKLDRRQVVELLVAELRPISTNAISYEEQSLRTDSMHVIWCIRALRYLTGLDFIAPTEHRFKESEEEQTRHQFLHNKSETEVAFFGVWMSREHTFVAPKDAQRAIIEKWRLWLSKEEKNFSYPETLQGFSEWYF